MKKIITAKINLRAVQQEHVYPGKKGDWLDIVIIPTANSQWSTHLIVQDTGEANRLIKSQRPIIGNGIQRSLLEGKTKPGRGFAPGGVIAA